MLADVTIQTHDGTIESQTILYSYWKHRFVVTLTINNLPIVNTNVLKNVIQALYKKMNCFSIVNFDLLTSNLKGSSCMFRCMLRPLLSEMSNIYTLKHGRHFWKLPSHEYCKLEHWNSIQIRLNVGTMCDLGCSKGLNIKSTA